MFHAIAGVLMSYEYDFDSHVLYVVVSVARVADEDTVHAPLLARVVLLCAA